MATQAGRAAPGGPDGTDADGADADGANADGAGSGSAAAGAPRPDAVRPAAGAIPDALAGATAGSRLAALRARASGAHAAVTAADDALRALAARRVTAERGLRRALAVRQAAQWAAAAHDRARPGPLTRLRRPFRAGPDWRRRRDILAAALAAAEPALAEARRAVSLSGDEFAAQVRVRGERAAALRRLTAACAAALEELNACRPHAGPPRGAPPPAGRDAPDGGPGPDEAGGGRVRQ